MKKLVLVIMFVLLAGCSTTMQSPRYSVSVDNMQALKRHETAKLMVYKFTQSAESSAQCRLFGPIEPADGVTIPQFISKAMNDELKMADIYSKNGTKLSGDVTKINFSSSNGITSGFWDISIKLTSDNGRAISVTNKYTFKSGLDAITACTATVAALSPAVQDLIKAIISHPEFKKLL